MCTVLAVTQRVGSNFVKGPLACVPGSNWARLRVTDVSCCSAAKLALVSTPWKPDHVSCSRLDCAKPKPNGPTRTAPPAFIVLLPGSPNSFLVFPKGLKSL